MTFNMIYYCMSSNGFYTHTILFLLLLSYVFHRNKENCVLSGVLKLQRYYWGCSKNDRFNGCCIFCFVHWHVFSIHLSSKQVCIYCEHCPYIIVDPFSSTSFKIQTDTHHHRFSFPCPTSTVALIKQIANYWFITKIVINCKVSQLVS